MTVQLPEYDNDFSGHLEHPTSSVTKLESWFSTTVPGESLEQTQLAGGTKQSRMRVWSRLGWVLEANCTKENNHLVPMSMYFFLSQFSSAHSDINDYYGV